MSTCDHFKEIVKNCVSYKKEVRCTNVAQNVDGKIVGGNVWRSRRTFSALVQW